MPNKCSKPMVRGLPMTPDNALATRRGDKIRTMRVIVPQPKRQLGYMYIGGGEAVQCGPDYPDGDKDVITCPYGIPGDILYIREPITRNDRGMAQYVADGLPVMVDGESLDWRWQVKTLIGRYSPKEAARTWVVITHVNVHRVQEITLEQVYAEGITWDESDEHEYRSPFFKFEAVWDQINAARGYPWKANNWVWALDYKLTGAQEAANAG